jgi:hypothetical protein
MSKIYTKYKFRGLCLLVLGDDNNFYRLPYSDGLRNYNLKQLTVKEHKGEKKLLYLNKRYTKGNLNSLKERHKVLLKEELSEVDVLLKIIDRVFSE